MSFLVDVGGRKAWPVRALPWVCGHDGPRWHLDAAEVARALAVDGVEWEDFSSVGAWRADGSPVEPACWASVADELDRLRESCNPYGEWQLRATLALPADAFVWAAEWTTAYNRCAHGPDNLRALLDESDMVPDERRELVDDVADREIVAVPQVSSGIAEAVMVGARKLCRAPTPEAMLSPEVAPAPKVQVQGGKEHQTPASPARAVVELSTMAGAAKRGRRDVLAPVIDAAQRVADDPQDSAQVFSVLIQWAKQQRPRYPLKGLTEEGIQWAADELEEPRYLSRNALSNRLRRRK